MEYWEKRFKEEGALWSFQPSDSALKTAKEFKQNGFQTILIPGIGYGRNAIPFLEKGLDLTGIEVSHSAIELARRKGYNFPIHNGSVLNMPFDNTFYDGIYCYSVLHLFNETERAQILDSCYNQLIIGGVMSFVVVSTKAEMFGQGEKLDDNYYRLDNGLAVFFYMQESIEKEFKKFGLREYSEIEEPIKFMKNAPSLKCWLVKCKKQD